MKLKWIESLKPSKNKDVGKTIFTVDIKVVHFYKECIISQFQ